ncbi:hypothetical protein L1987_11922 [Smallanthus sonchifolius]|uniref:Uncharacterized protein n=1 Tax=Smallanthus sonchifolius TaxID=185202 RepID=A0ACB9JD67_9ASTR|nr:hypothetical protein L1987_11922 [Smallanthus sonchifolius]
MDRKNTRETTPSTRAHPDSSYSQPPIVTYNPSHHNAPVPQIRLDARYARIANNYRSLEQITLALADAGLESSKLIVGIDFTKSNEWTVAICKTKLGERSFNRRSLHSLEVLQNPYEQAISTIGKTLAAFDDDNLIPCFGFGDVSTHDHSVFSFYPDSRSCQGFEDVLRRYREIVPHVKLAADGQVTRSVDTEYGQLSLQECNTIDAIVKASNYPLSIFVNFTDIMSKNINPVRKETEFALYALMEIPLQYQATIQLGLLGSRTRRATAPLPPPCGSNLRNSSVPEYDVNMMPSTSSNSTYDNKTCCECAAGLSLCPICRKQIKIRIMSRQ